MLFGTCAMPPKPMPMLADALLLARYIPFHANGFFSIIRWHAGIGCCCCCLSLVDFIFQLFFVHSLFQSLSFVGRSIRFEFWWGFYDIWLFIHFLSLFRQVSEVRVCIHISTSITHTSYLIFNAFWIFFFFFLLLFTCNSFPMALNGFCFLVVRPDNEIKANNWNVIFWCAN